MGDALALNLPAFWSAQPAVWFAQADAQFKVRGIKDDSTKYYYVVAALDQQTIGRCSRSPAYGECLRIIEGKTAIDLRIGQT